tara:strand:- start:239 stop:1621 length:1383 start_codon:yes stop_codon:yes gene_type:complete
MKGNKKNKTLQDDIKNFAKLVEKAKILIEDKTPVFQRNTLIRCAGRDLGLLLNETAIFGILGKARRELEGTQDGYQPNEKIKIPKTKWLWEDLISEGNVSLVVALPKVGKSSLIGGFLGAMSCGNSEYLGKQITSKAKHIYCLGTDQPMTDWAEIFIPVGLMKKTAEDEVELVNPLKRLWTMDRPITLTEETIEQIHDLAVKDPDSIFVLDAFASLISGLGLDENHVDAVEPIRMLCEALSGTGATIVLLHHASGTNSNERAVKASRGTKALPALASNIINLSWLVQDNKTDNRIAVTTQGRSSKPVDMVIEQIDRAVWQNHGSSAEIKEEMKLEKIESNLSERQNLVLAHVNACKDPWPTIAQVVAKELADEYGANADVKALATLNQLHKKGLIKKSTFSTIKVGNYSAFYPRNWDGCCTMTPEKYDWLIAKLKDLKHHNACREEDEKHKQRKLELKNN